MLACRAGSSSRAARTLSSEHTRHFIDAGDTQRPDVVGRNSDSKRLMCEPMAEGSSAKKSCASPASGMLLSQKLVQNSF